MAPSKCCIFATEIDIDRFTACARIASTKQILGVSKMVKNFIKDFVFCAVVLLAVFGPYIYRVYF